MTRPGIAPVSIVAVIVAALVFGGGCAGGGDVDAAPTPFAVDVVSFTPGDGAGFGADLMPGIVLGPPKGGGETHQGTDVVSLGKGGVIVLAMGEEIEDGDGADLIVFENAFKASTGALFGEPGQVSVSDDGDAFADFPCAPTDPPPNGCAGFSPVLADDADTAVDPAHAGGDRFDLADVGVERARFVKITDVGAGGPAPKAGFDLDAVAVVAR